MRIGLQVWSRIVMAFLIVAVIVIGYPVIRSPVIRQDIINDYAARRAKYLGIPLVMLGDSQVEKNVAWGWDLERNPLDAAVFAMGGATIWQVAGYCDKIEGLRPQTIVIMAGSNDAFLNVPVEQSVASYLTMVRDLKRYGARIIVTLSPPSRDAIQSAHVRQLNSVLFQKLRGEHVEILALPQFTGKDGLANLIYFNSDGVHLNKAGYSLWEDKLRAMHVG